MADQITVSSTANPYQAGVYSAGSNSKNTMDVNSFIKLLAAQLSNQDMTSPMDNSEMMPRSPKPPGTMMPSTSAKASLQAA